MQEVVFNLLRPCYELASLWKQSADIAAQHGTGLRLAYQETTTWVLLAFGLVTETVITHRRPILQGILTKEVTARAQTVHVPVGFSSFI
jgi:hypothetical protein